MASAHYLRLKTLSGSGKLSAAARHNKRAIQRELGAAGHIDPSRSHLNYCLVGELSPEAVIAKSKAMREAAGIKKLRKNAVQGIEVLFSLPAATQIDLHAYFTACTSWVGGEFGNQNILSADVHLDEAAPHCHVRSGSANLNSVLSGNSDLSTGVTHGQESIIGAAYAPHIER